jgi:hypothetical protein
MRKDDSVKMTCKEMQPHTNKIDLVVAMGNSSLPSALPYLSMLDVHGASLSPNS